MSQPDDIDLDAVARLTLDDYAQRAERFWEGTRDHDVSQNIDALLRHIHGAAPLRILDLGCGPGRDLMTFTRLGHEAVGLDGCARFVDMARAHSGCEVWHQDFMDLSLPAGRFDGVFANASLFHVPRRLIQDVLGRLFQALRPGGVLCASNPRGDNQEGWNNQRYGVYYDYGQWAATMQRAGFTELEHFYRPSGLPRAQQPWLVTVWRRPENAVEPPVR